jgi:hypothetical protein
MWSTPRRRGEVPEDRASPKPRTPEPAAPQSVAQRLLGLQRTVGNAQTARLLRQETAAPPAPPVKTAPQAVELKIEPDTAIVFKTATAKVGDLNVQVTARMSVKGTAVLVNQKLPDKKVSQFVHTKVRELTATAFGAATPTGAAGKIELPLAGDTLVLELADGADKSPAFEVSGRFAAAKRSFTVPGCEISDASITLDATVWISPAAAPAATATAAGDASVKRFAFAGATAKLADPRAGSKEAPRSGTVVSKAAMDAFETKVPAFVKDHAFLKLPEQRAAFFQQMRAYFGDDMKAVDHFAAFRKPSIKGAATIVHDETATRLEKVQAEIGTDKMPSSGGVGWPRSECQLSGRQDVANLHNLGYAVDYNAYEAPHFKDDVALRDLVVIVTGRLPTASYPAAPANARKIGETYTSGTDEEKQKLDADQKVKTWLDGVAKETEALGKASEDFRASLKGKDAAGADVDFAPKLQELRTKWFAAGKNKTEQDKVLAELPIVLKPWLDKVGAQKTAMETKIRAAGLDPATLPTGDDLVKAAQAADGLKGRVDRTRKALGTPLKKGERASVDKLIAEARKLTGDTTEPADKADEAAVKELERLGALVDKRDTALGQKKWLDRVNALNAKLTGNAAFVFGHSTAPQAIDPSLAQLVDRGFYTLKGSPGADPEAFGPEFVRSMIKHGFTHGGTWGTPDLMHFELRWAGSAAGP